MLFWPTNERRVHFLKVLIVRRRMRGRELSRVCICPGWQLNGLRRKEACEVWRKGWIGRGREEDRAGR